MWIDRAIRWLLPKDERFYDLLEQGAECAARASALMLECCSAPTYAERVAIVDKLKEEEHRADRVIQDVYSSLNKTFITPIDRSDIYALATEMENVNDVLHSTSTFIVVHAMEDLPEGSVEIARLIKASGDEMFAAVKDLPTRRGPVDIRRRCKRITEMESEGDRIFRTHIGALYRNEKDAVRLLKHKEFLEGLEHALDLYDDVGNSLETLVIKNM